MRFWSVVDYLVLGKHRTGDRVFHALFLAGVGWVVGWAFFDKATNPLLVGLPLAFFCFGFPYAALRNGEFKTLWNRLLYFTLFWMAAIHYFVTDLEKSHELNILMSVLALLAVSFFSSIYDETTKVKCEKCSSKSLYLSQYCSHCGNELTDLKENLGSENKSA